MRGPRAEVEQLLRLALQHAAPALTSAARDPQRHARRQRMMSKWLSVHASPLVVQGKPGAAAAPARQAISLGQANESVEGETLGLLALAQALHYTNQPAEARARFEQVLQLARRYRSQVATSDALVDAERIACEYLAGMTLAAGD